MGSYKTFKDILEETKMKEGMDSLNPPSSDEISFSEKKTGARSFKDPASKTTLTSPIEAEKLKEDISKARQAADYEAKKAKEEAQKLKEIEKTAKQRIVDENKIKTIQAKEAARAQAQNPSFQKKAAKLAEESLEAGAKEFEPTLMGKLATLAEKVPNHRFVKSLKPIANVALKAAPVVGAVSTAMDVLDPEITATEEQELASMNQGQRELAEGRNPFKASSPGRPATALERMDVVGLKQSVDPSSYPVNDSKNTSSINDIDSIIKSDLSSDFNQNYNKKLNTLTPEEKIFFDKESSYLNKNVPAKEQMEAQTKILDKVISNRSQFLQKELNEYVKNIQNSNLPEERKQQLIQEKINGFNKNQLPFNTESSSSGDSLIASSPSVAVVDESKNQPSTGSVSKQQVGAAPKLASSAVDKEVQSLIDQQKSSNQYYQDLMNQYNQIQKFGQDKQLIGRLGEAGEDLAYALARAKKPESSFYKDFAKSGETDIEQFKEKTAFEKKARLEDPTSEESKAARKLLKEQGITNIPDTVSAAFIEKNYPQFANLLSKKERAEEVAFAKEERRKEKLTADQNSYLERQSRGFAKDKVHEALFILKDAKRAIEDYLNDPTPTKAQSLKYAFAKVNDPNSVVRESELKLFGQAGSLYDKFKNEIQAGIKGTITDKKAKEFNAFISSKIKSAETDLKTKLGPIIEGGNRRSISLQDTIEGVAGPEYYRQLFENTQSEPILENKIIVEKDGKRFKLPKEQLNTALKQGYKEIK